MTIQLKDTVNIVKRKEGTLVYSSNAGKLFKTSEVGSFILDLIAEKKYDEKQIIEILKNKFSSVNRDELEKDLKDFLNQLKKCSLI